MSAVVEPHAIVGRDSTEYAQFLVQSRRTGEAIQVLEAILATGESSWACSLLAQAYLDSGNNTEARRCAARALALDPESYASWEVLSRLYLKLGPKKEAVTAARRGLALNASSPSAVYNLGYVYLKTGHQKEARLAVDRLSSLAPDALSTHLLAADVATAVHSWKDAERSYQEALRIDPENAVVINNLGVCLLKQGRSLEARAMFHQMMRTHPGSTLAASNLKVATGRSLGFRWFRRRNLLLVYLVAILIAAQLRVRGFVVPATYVTFVGMGLVIVSIAGPLTLWMIGSRSLSQDVQTLFRLHMRARIVRPRVWIVVMLLVLTVLLVARSALS